MQLYSSPNDMPLGSRIRGGLRWGGERGARHVGLQTARGDPAEDAAHRGNAAQEAGARVENNGNGMVGGV